MVNFEQILSVLSEQRPVFHSEADFQHAFAWVIHKEYPSAKIRLERPCVGRKGRIYLDIWIELKGKRIGVELKYKTKQLQASVDNEEFKLLNQSAQDIARYNSLNDLQRIEGLLEADLIKKGFTIFLTNDPGYWTDSGRKNRVDEKFRIHEDRIVNGKLTWAEHASEGTIGNNDKPIVISGSYKINWLPYSEIENKPFRYLLLEAKA